MSLKITLAHNSASGTKTAQQMLDEMASRDIRPFLDDTCEPPKTAEEMLAEMAANAESLYPGINEMRDLRPSPELEKVFAALRAPKHSQ